MPITSDRAFDRKTNFKITDTLDTNWLRTVYRLRGLKRYNDRIQLLSEDVAQHSYFVTLIVLKLYEAYQFNLERALSMAIIHDLPEIHCSDVSHRVKALYPEVAQAIKLVENKVWATEFPPEWAALAKEEGEAQTAEALAVKLADAISVLQYSDCECLLGNGSEEMQSVYSYTLDRIGRVMSKLERYLRIKIQIEAVLAGPSKCPKRVYIEGIDRSGKDSLMAELAARHSWFIHSNYVTVRGPLSMLVYNEQFSRGVDPECYWEMMPKRSEILYLTIPSVLALERIKGSDHEPLSQEYLQASLDIYSRMLDEARVRGHEVHMFSGAHPTSSLAQFTVHQITQS